MSTLEGAGYLEFPETGYAIYRWDSATGTWDTYLFGITPAFDVKAYDVIVAYVPVDKNITIT